MSANNFNELREHVGHAIECVCYGPPEAIVNVSIECITCNMVLVSYDAPKAQKDRVFKPFPKSATQGGKSR